MQLRGGGHGGYRNAGEIVLAVGGAARVIVVTIAIVAVIVIVGFAFLKNMNVIVALNYPHVSIALFPRSAVPASSRSRLAVVTRRLGVLPRSFPFVLSLVLALLLAVNNPVDFTGGRRRRRELLL